jgi:hypothetical protein
MKPVDRLGTNNVEYNGTARINATNMAPVQHTLLALLIFD